MRGKFLTVISSARLHVLVIQPSFIGDVVLTTGLCESLLEAGHFVDILIRAGNEGLLAAHPRLNEVLVWEKRKNKYLHWLQLMQTIRRNRYDVVINPHRFWSTGLWTALSGAGQRFGFRQNPMSFTYTYKAEHVFEHGLHEVDRNFSLAAPLKLGLSARPRLYPSRDDFAVAKLAKKPFVTLAPSSVWYTKRYPFEKWALLIRQLPREVEVHLLGSATERGLCEELAIASGRPCKIRAGELSLLGSAALMAEAKMNYVNDSAPLHLASAMNAPVTAFFLSTAPVLGFIPLSDEFKICESPHILNCRPCGSTGKKACPLGHFRCSDIEPIP